MELLLCDQGERVNCDDFEKASPSGDLGCWGLFKISLGFIGVLRVSVSCYRDARMLIDGVLDGVRCAEF